MTRLSDSLSLEQRHRLSLTLASGVLAAVTSVGLRAIVITPADDVAMWAVEHDATVCADPGKGLSEAAHAGVSMVGDAPWLVIHADLPLVTPAAIAVLAETCESSTVIVPSHDGGTAVIGSRGPFTFSYGVGSFQHHYASAPDATVIVSPELGVDIDTARHLASFPHLAGG